MDNKMYLKEPVYGQIVETKLGKMSDCIYGLNWSLKAKGYLTLKDYRDILANMLGMIIPEMNFDDEIGFSQFGGIETDVFYHSEIQAEYDHKNGEFILSTAIKYRSPDGGEA